MYVEFWHLAMVIIIVFSVGYYRDRQLQKMIDHVSFLHDVDTNIKVDTEIDRMKKLINDKDRKSLAGLVLTCITQGGDKFSFKILRVDNSK